MRTEASCHYWMRFSSVLEWAFSMKRSTWKVKHLHNYKLLTTETFIIHENNYSKYDKNTIK